MIKKNIITDQVFGSPGYCSDFRLNADELGQMRAFIEENWLAVLMKSYPEHVEKFRPKGLAYYHQHSHLISHETLWVKENRLLSAEQVEQIKQMPFLKGLREFFDDFVISEVVYGDTIEKREEIYWRLVRPHSPSDIGPLHTDKWFHDIVGEYSTGLYPAGTVTAKVWIPIWCEPEKNGLKIVPDSNQRPWKHRYVNKGGVEKPQLDEEAEGILIETPPGNMLIFSENTLHGGTLNVGETTRVSVEITLVFPP
ncbi:MAG: phytanoyl-CoA dioxygenase family protein [Verrucomicrobiae bacterium]|nr:phytanoyl-CoA dioxygenase family protein [Verrucomicrobiae bacterium]